jgi:preprotein translocase subunit SecA
MIKNILYKIFGTRNERLLKQYIEIVNKINNIEEDIVKLSDMELKDKTAEFKLRIKNGSTLDEILPEAFAVCREASKRVLNMRHFDVQLLGGIVLHNNKIAEMKTGEGKTLVATLAVYLNALLDKGVHVITVNDYLASRDAKEMGKLYNFLGLSVGVNLSGLDHLEKKQSYNCDITYGTNNEFGFDYLRDNMVFDVSDKVQRELNFALIDEVDSILIDEARTPLIISGPAEGSGELYKKLNKLPNDLIKQDLEDSKDGDYWVDEKNHNVILSELGHEKVENTLVSMGLLDSNDTLYSPQNISLMHHVLAALKAHFIYNKDQHYVIQDGEVVIVDEFTGRLMQGRRWSDGLHQAVEAKEGVVIQNENQTLASITFQNYFRMYKKLAGMTGTADTEAYEFQQIYGLETIIIPTHRLMIRNDLNDQIYMTLAEKYEAIVKVVQDCYQREQPVLIGTTSVENSEIISRLLKKSGLNHQVLNAKQHQKEADIIIQAGRPKAVTVATNMAGRGTDIILGGNPKPQIEAILNNNKLSDEEKAKQIAVVQHDWQIANKKVLESGGLAIIGTERHESRRIDNQLRGRSGRQGDVGMSRFYLSLDDPLLRIFGGEKMKAMMLRFIKDGESIEHKWLTRSIESAQRKVEGHNFDIRKQLLEYDNVFNDQRNVIYNQRNEILLSMDLTSVALAIIKSVMGKLVEQYLINEDVNDDDLSLFQKHLQNNYLLSFDIESLFINNKNIKRSELQEKVTNFAVQQFQAKILIFEAKIKEDINLFIDNLLASEVVNLKPLDDFIEQNKLPISNKFYDYFALNPHLTKYDLKEYILKSLEIISNVQIVRFIKNIILQNIDYNYRIHLTQLEQLRQGIHLRGYAQKDPKREFQSESFILFANLLDNIKLDIAKILLTVQIHGINDVAIEENNLETAKFIHNNIDDKNTNISRNSPCHCGSGKKYKHCHGKLN